MQSFASKIFFHWETGEITNKFFPFVWETRMIQTRKCLLVDVFLSRRLSKSLAFCEFASVNFEPCFNDAKQPPKVNFARIQFSSVYCFAIKIFKSRSSKCLKANGEEVQGNPPSLQGMGSFSIWCITNPTPTRRVSPPWDVYMAKFHFTNHIIVIKLKWEIIWTGGLPHQSGLPHLPGVPDLHLNRCKPVAGVAHFSHLCLELFFVKIFFQYLVLRARDLASLMTSKLIKKSFEFNRSICQQYDYIVNRITSSAKTTEELVDLEKYIDNLRSGPLVHLRVCQL